MTTGQQMASFDIVDMIKGTRMPMLHNMLYAKNLLVNTNITFQDDPKLEVDM